MIRFTHSMFVNGDIAAFDHYYHQYKKIIYANIFRILRHTEATEDIMQDVFISFWENRDKIQSEQHVVSWLFLTSHNKSLKWLKKQIRQAISLDTTLAESLPEYESTTDIYYDTQLELVASAITQLPEKKKLAFCLYKLEGKTLEEVAAITGLTVESSKSYIKQANKHIKKYVEEHYSEKIALLTILYLWINDRF